jgi:hypothetical protein
MIYAEGITDRGEAAAEIGAYARMLPNSHELSCTLFIELDDVTTVKTELERLAGIQSTLHVDVGDERVQGHELPGLDDDAGSLAGRTASVHFLKFTFTDDQRDAFRDPEVPARLVVDHPAYADDVTIDGAVRRILLADLALDGATTSVT